MGLNPRSLFLALCASLTAGFAGQALADAVIATAVTSGDPSLAGTEFTVSVDIASNDTGLTPAAAAYRLSYPSNSVELISVADLELGPALAGPVEGTAPNAFRDVATAGDSTNMNLTPGINTARFRVLENAAANYTISVEGDPDAPVTILATDLATSIPASYDFSATSSLAAAIQKTGVASTASSSSVDWNETFTVTVALTGNPYPLDVAAGTFRLNFDATSVEFVSVAGGSLGPAYAGLIEGTAPANFIDFGTLGDASNTADQAEFATLTFRVKPFASTSSVSFSLSKDPSAGATVIASDLSTDLAVEFDSSASQNITIVGPAPAVVVASLDSGDPSLRGTAFAVAVDVTDNQTAAAPTSAAFRVRYSPETVTITGADQAELGPVYVGPVEVDGIGTFRDIGTLGDVTNTSINPRAFVVNFETLACAANGVSTFVNISDDPDAGGTLTSIDVPTSSIREIAHTFDSSALSAFTVEQLDADISLSDSLVSLSVNEGEDTSFSFDVNNQIACTTDVNVSTTSTLAAINPSSVTVAGNGTESITVDVNSSSLAPGAYTFFVNAASADGADAEVVTVNLTVVPIPRATIVASVDSGDPSLRGTAFAVAVDVTANPTTYAPTSVAFRVRYSPETVTISGVDQAELGPVYIGPVEVDGIGTFRDIGTLGDATNTSLNPRAFVVNFETLACAVNGVSTSISIGDDPDAGGTLTSIDVPSSTIREIAHNFDSSAVSSFAVEQLDADLSLSDSLVSLSVNEGEDTSFSFDVNNLIACPTDVNLSTTSTLATINPSSVTVAGNGTESITVDIASSSLAPGDYTLFVNAASADGSDAEAVTVNLTVVPDSAIELTPNSFTLVTNQGENVDPTSFVIANTGGQDLNFLVSVDQTWVDAAPTTGTLNPGADQSVDLTFDVAGLSAGIYNATVTVADAGASNSPQNVSIELTVLGQPEIAVNPSTINRTIFITETAAPANLTLSNTGFDVLDYAIEVDPSSPWLSVTPSTGTLALQTNTPLTVTFDTAALSGGNYTGSFTVVDQGGEAANVTVNVNLTINIPPAEIAGTIISGNPCIAGSEFVVRYAVASNVTGLVPRNFQLRANWNSNSVVFVSATAVNLGSLSLGPVQGTAPNRSRSIGTLNGGSNINASNFTPGLVDIRFRVQGEGFAAPYSVTATVDGINPALLGGPVDLDGPGGVNETAGTIIPSTILNGNTTNIGTCAILAASPLSVDVNAEYNTNPADQIVTLTNSGNIALNYTANSADAWLTVAPSTASINASTTAALTLSFDVAGVLPGVYNTTVTVNAGSALGSPVTIPVSVTIVDSNPPVITLNPGSVDRSIAFGETAAPAGIVIANTASGAPLNYTASVDETFVSVSPDSGSLNGNTTGTLTLTFDTATLLPGTYTANLTVDGNATNSPVVLPITVTVLDLEPAIAEVNPTSVAVTIDERTAAAPAIVSLANLGTGTPLVYTADTDNALVEVSPDSGSVDAGTTTPLTLTFVDTADLAPGVYSSVLNIASNASNAPTTVGITLTVNNVIDPAILTLTPDSLDVDADQGSSPANQVAVVGNNGEADLSFSAATSEAFVTVSPTTGTLVNGATANLTLAFNTTSLAPGDYTANLTVTDLDNGTTAVTVITVTINEVGVPPADTVAFEFNDDEQGWQFSNPILTLENGIVTEPSTSNAGAVTGSIDIVTTSTQSFAYWSSPRFQVVSDLSELIPGSVAIGGTTGSDSLFRATVNVSTDVTSQALVPSFRIRSSAWDWQQADVLVVTSVPEINPTAVTYLPTDAGRNYSSYFTQPISVNDFRVDFDLTAFDPLDANTAILSINSVTVDNIGVNGLTEVAEVVALDFRGGNANGFTFRDLAPVFQVPAAEATNVGLSLSGLDPARGVTVNPIPYPTPVSRVGFWGAEFPDVTLSGGAIYRVDWTVESDAVDAAVVPTFRLRVNTSSLVLSSYVNVNSTNSASRVPVAGVPQTYSLFFEVPAELEGDFWIFSFDYVLSENGTNDDRNVTLSLTDLVVTEYSEN